MSKDILGDYPETQVAEWYRRLADRIGREKINGQEPLSAQFLRHYIDNRNRQSTFSPPPPAHLRNSSFVFDALKYHRQVFLTEEKARLGSGKQIKKKWVGIIPRLQGWSGFSKWTPGSLLRLEYQSLVEMPLRLQLYGSPEEKDLLTSLRGFQLKSIVSLRGEAIAGTTRIKITFQEWDCHALDRYDFDFKEYFTVPNPDYGSNLPGAIEPKQKSIRVYHKNAQRLEQRGLAAPYDIDMKWRLTDNRIIQPAEVDQNRKLKP